MIATGDEAQIEWNEAHDEPRTGGRLFFAVMDGIRPIGLLVVGRSHSFDGWPSLPSPLPRGRHPLLWTDSAWGEETFVKLWDLDEKVKEYPPWSRLFGSTTNR